MYLGKEDVAVCNKKAKEVFDLIPGDEKKIITVDGLGHGSFSDGLIAPFTYETVHNHFEKYRMNFKYEKREPIEDIKVMEVPSIHESQTQSKESDELMFSFGAAASLTVLGTNQR